MRPITGPDEVELFNRIPYAFNHEVAEDLAAGRRRRDWTWLALDSEGRLLARVAWWSRPGDTDPALLDIFDYLPGHEATGAALLRTALAAVVPEGGTPAKYTRFLPPDWREDPAVRTAVDGRLAIVERLGARLFVERLRLEWTPGSPDADPPSADSPSADSPDAGAVDAGPPVPGPTGRLAFRPVAGEGELLDLLTEILTGTLDAYSLDDLRQMTARQAARLQFDEEFAHFTSPRDWWRVATLPGSGEPVGLVIAARNQYRPIIAYLGVLPAHRGQGHIDEILAEGTRVLAATEPECVRASTDVGNAPMAAAFARAGYAAFEREIVMTWD
ncbi:GNAT family N-acetyltransferase [Kitasatospora sp. NBC_01287]|uniref:GNAT family N-acetyltransferase n=1 Tax=Kitasatospora sp. NBC_01287 TaxID=2903573 RepID=UPI00225ACE25|nr:GNAT family N-acetyltransferase [Kitasatospora sp. NBC_01287]MCX4745650.1 GNAT family N-acetyltransferase [Kitasatospora sp. NBC_01287]